MASTIKVNNIQNQCGANIANKCGSTVTLGASGDTITLACGATAAGFGSTGEVSWDTTKKTSGFTAVSGVGYFCDTTSAAFTVTLPATPSAGNVVAVSDYAGTFNTNNLTIARNGSNINGSANDFIIGKNNVTAQFIYVDATQGWRVVFTGSQTGEGLLEGFMCATGGTITTCGNFKIHTFTGPGTFTVNSLACSPANDVVDYLVVAGGGSGGAINSGAGGAGGYRESSGTATGCYTASPLGACVSALSVSAQGYPITIGAGGASVNCQNCQGNDGSNSVFSTITSTGGGGGGSNGSLKNGRPGGSGGSATDGGSGGSGNTPPTSPPQGNGGGPSTTSSSGGGGGGAGGAGTTATVENVGANGANGATTSINGSPTTYAGGGGGGGRPLGSGTTPQGGTGGGGNGSNSGNGSPGTANTGGGGGGSAPCNACSGSGGSGVVIIRYKYQ